MSSAHDTLTLGKRGELFVFNELLQRGVVPYAPLIDMEGIDCVVRQREGRYLEVQVKTNNTPEDPMWWSVTYAPRRDDYIFVFIAVSLDWTTWVIPATQFHELATGPTKAGRYNLDFGTRARAPRAEPYKNNWDPIVSRAEKELVPRISPDVQKRPDLSTLA